MSSKRKGSRPSRGKPSAPDQDVLASLRGQKDEYPLLSMRFLQKDWGFSPLDDSMRLAFLEKWHKRSSFTWKELAQHQGHGLGSEFIPSSQIKPAIPRQFQDVEKFRVFRHQGNLPFVGWRDGAIFYLIWIEKEYNDLYNHS